MSDSPTPPATTDGPHDATQQTSPDGEQPRAPQPQPSENLKQGLRLLWQAARDTGEQVRREAEKRQIGTLVQQAGSRIEAVASRAGKQLDQVLERLQPLPPRYQKGWPTTEQEADSWARGETEDTGIQAQETASSPKNSSELRIDVGEVPPESPDDSQP